MAGRMTSSCEQCGAEFKHKPSSLGRFCSVLCYRASRREGTDAPRKKCCQCRKSFRPRPKEKPNEYAARTYCSRECVTSSQRRAAKGAGWPELDTSPKEFLTRLHRVHPLPAHKVWKRVGLS